MTIEFPTAMRPCRNDGRAQVTAEVKSSLIRSRQRSDPRDCSVDGYWTASLEHGSRQLSRCFSFSARDLLLGTPHQAGRDCVRDREWAHRRERVLAQR
jgi:hypothetical protein